MPINIIGGATLANHGNQEDTDVGGASADAAKMCVYNTRADGYIASTVTITTTKRCAIVVFGIGVAAVNTASSFEIRRGGTDKTTEETISVVGWAANLLYCHMLYAVEILDAGTYTYDLVNGSGGVLNIYGTCIKLCAVSGD